jgi:hypothetical protein
MGRSKERVLKDLFGVASAKEIGLCDGDDKPYRRTRSGSLPRLDPDSRPAKRLKADEHSTVSADADIPAATVTRVTRSSAKEELTAAVETSILRDSRRRPAPFVGNDHVRKSRNSQNKGLLQSQTPSPPDETALEMVVAALCEGYQSPKTDAVRSAR